MKCWIDKYCIKDNGRLEIGETVAVNANYYTCDSQNRLVKTERAV